MESGVLRPGCSPTPWGRTPIPHSLKVATSKVTDSKVTVSRSQSQGHGLGERFSCLSVPSPALLTPELGGTPSFSQRRSSGVGTTASPLGPEMWAQMMVHAQPRRLRTEGCGRVWKAKTTETPAGDGADPGQGEPLRGDLRLPPNQRGPDTKFRSLVTWVGQG